MVRINGRAWVGGGLLLLGFLLLLQEFGFVRGAAGLFWGAALTLGGLVFLSQFFRDIGGRWWAIIPAMSLIGLGAGGFLPESLSNLGGALFLGCLGIAFWVVYLTNRMRWWGMIPGGVLLTLAAVTTVDSYLSLSGGSLLFVGLGLTFFLVALLPNPTTNTRWAYIPAVFLVILGAALGFGATAGLAAYIWPAALIVMGLALVGGVLWNR